jgi:two-component system sensor histidine kinase VanS
MSKSGSPDGSVGLRFGRSIRARFTFGTTALFGLIGAAMLFVVYLAMRYIPSYHFPQLDEASPTWAPTTLPTPIHTGEAVSTGIVVSNTPDLLNTLLVISAVSLIGLSALGAVASWVFTGRMLRPLTALSNAASRAQQGSLSHRINSSGSGDELQRLSDSFDAMLEQIERSFAAQQRFAANASHEIRTPLATTKALLDVAQEGETAPETVLLLERLSEMNQRTISITNAMLDLATIGENSLDISHVDISAIVSEQLRELEGETEEMKIRVTADLHQGSVAGDAALLQLMIGNILRNAVRHNVHGGEVSVSVLPRIDRIDLEVSNTGAAVPSEMIELLSEPFYRIYGRVQSTDRRSGRGLGLALAASIIDAHHGTLRLESRAAGGLTVSVSLPV